MSYILNDFLNIFQNPVTLSYLSIKLVFLKQKNESKIHDFIAVVPPEARKHTIGSKDISRFLQLLVKRERPWLMDLINFDVSDFYVYVSFDRNLTFKNALASVSSLETKYGSNNDLEGKVICLQKYFDTPSCMTELRIQKAHTILSNLIYFCGGNIVENETDAHQILCLSNKSNCENIILIGTVLDTKTSSKSTLNLDEYYKIRTEEIKLMSEYKLETNCDNDNLNDLVHSTVLFDMVQSNLQKFVFISSNSEKSNCKGALFVLYNYVRLSKLLSKFQDLVNSSVYPPLPDMEEINFSLLIDEEWKILLDFILYWPIIVKNSLKDLDIGRPKLHVLFHFLIDFSTRFSLYYHRIKILTDPRPNLIPVLHARIYLLFTLRQIIQNVFDLTSIRSINKM